MKKKKYSYDHTAIEKKWQKYWQSKKTYTTDSQKGNKFYILDMFPYPSGEGLHVGHPKGYIATDVVSRMKRMQGFSVLHPMGFDAFGLPAENYAIKTKTNPATAVAKNVKRYKKQLELIGLDYDWSREINTTDPEFYHWTQWIFLQLYKKGLAFESNEPINWCPVDKTGLANEDIVDGHCERCGSLVEKRPMRQWVLRITDYAERLLADLDAKDDSGKPLLDWPQSIKELQRNWIGKSEGALVRFVVKGTQEPLTVFTTRIDTIYSGTFVIVAPEHTFIDAHKDAIQNYDEVLAYRDSVKSKTDIERTDKNNKTGVQLKGITVINPANGAEIPVWTSDFVLVGYGTGAVFADAHDQRDFDMAKKYNIPLATSLRPEGNLPEDRLRAIEQLESCFDGEGILVNSAEFNGLTSAAARPKIIDALARKGLAERKTNYKLRDWVFSRQRYWGEPIPLIHCEQCGVVPVPEDQLPVTLPKVKSYEPTGTGESPLAAITKWVNVSCPKCGGKAKRETNTMPQWAGSSWYYLRYIDPHNKTALVDRTLERMWQPVDLYVGGAEHATRHLIYARFWHKFLFDIGAVTTSEPFKKLQHVGLIIAEDGRKMSKRYGNVVNPDDVIATYGADTLRVYEMFMGPFDQEISWSTANMIGSRRFIERVFKLHERIGEATLSEQTETLLHKTIKKVTEDIEAMRFNTAISAMMILLNEFESHEVISQDAYIAFVKLIAPFAPHAADELWSILGQKGSIHLAPWSQFNPEKITERTVSMAIQVNGKVRSELTARHDESDEELRSRALSDAKITPWISGKTVEKVIIVKGKLISIVAK